jgi:hypothetical protein
MMSVEQSVEWELAGETEVLGRKPTPVPLFPPQIPHDLGSNPGRRGEKTATNRLSYGTAYLLWFVKSPVIVGFPCLTHSFLFLSV